MTPDSNSLFPSGLPQDLLRQIEAIIFASQNPISLPEIHTILELESLLQSDLATMIATLQDEHHARKGGFELIHIKGVGYQFRTVPDVALVMERMFTQRPRPLSRAAQETLAIIAYRQPVTRADVEFIRGVDAGSILKNLLDKNLIECVGRKEIIGRPMMFGTTPEFLRTYHLTSLEDLPPLDAFQPAVDVVKKALKRIDDRPDPAEENAKEGSGQSGTDDDLVI